MTKRDRITTEGQVSRTNRQDRSPDGCLVCIKAQSKHQLWPGKRPPVVETQDDAEVNILRPFGKDMVHSKCTADDYEDTAEDFVNNTSNHGHLQVPCPLILLSRILLSRRQPVMRCPKKHTLHLSNLMAKRSGRGSISWNTSRNSRIPACAII
jgi:hypothetical protein